MAHVRVYAIRQTPDYFTVLMDDGGIAEMHHNGEHWVSTYFQDRCNAMFDDEMWIGLADSKQYIKDWEEKKSVDTEMLMDALSWLDPSCKHENFICIEWDRLVNIIINN